MRGDPTGTKYDPAYRPPPPRAWTREELRPSDLWHGMDALRVDAAEGFPGAAAVLFEIERLRADLARIPRYAVSKHRTHVWTGRRWRERACSGFG